MGLEVSDTRINGTDRAIVRISWTTVDAILADYKNDEFQSFERAKVFAWASDELPSWALAMSGEDFQVDGRGVFLVGPALTSTELASTRPPPAAASKVA